MREEKKKLGHRAPAWSGAAIAPGPRPMGKGKRREVGGAAHARRRRFRSGGGEKTREREIEGGVPRSPREFPRRRVPLRGFCVFGGKTTADVHVAFFSSSGLAFFFHLSFPLSLPIVLARSFFPHHRHHRRLVRRSSSP